MYTKPLRFLSFCLIVLCYLIFPERGYSQQQKIDSLTSLLPKTKGVDRIDILYQLGLESIVIGNNDNGYLYAEESEELSYKIGDSLRIVKTGLLKASALRRLEKLTEAVATYKEILGVANRNRYENEIKVLLNSLALTYTFLAEYDKALELYFTSLVLREKGGNKAEISIALNNIGFVYFKIRNYEHAVEYYKRSLKFKEEANDQVGLETLLINIGLCYNLLGKFDDALKSIQRAFDVCKNDCSINVQIEGEFGLGAGYYGQKKFTDAESYFRKSLEKAKINDAKRFQVENLIYLGRIYLASDRLDDAQKVLADAENIAYSIGYNQQLIDTYREFSNLYNKVSDYKQASSYQHKYIHLKDSLYSEELMKNLAKVQTDFAERENIATIAAKEVVIEQQRYLNFAMVIIAMLAALLMLVVQRSNRVTKRVNAKLSMANETIEQQNKKLAAHNKVLDLEVAQKTADLERVNISLKQVNDELDNFIYKTSHDIRGPLASLKGMCNVALMDVKDVVALDYLRKLDITAERLNSILTRLLIVNQINNSKLLVSRINFRSIVNEVIKLEKKKGLPPNLQIVKKIDSEAYVHSDQEIVRIILENLIDNSIKFYNDSPRVTPFVEVHILQHEDGGVKARIIDNGIGIAEQNPGKLFQMFFRASERSEVGGIGLYIVKTSVLKLGGKVELVTTPEGYTEFFVLFPPHPPVQEEEKKENKKQARQGDHTGLMV